MPRRVRNKVDIFGAAAPGPSTNIIGPGLPVTASAQGSADIVLQVSGSFANATIFQALVTRGASTQTLRFNDATPIGAQAIQTFQLPVTAGDVVNFQIVTDGAIQVLRVEEIHDGADS